MGYTIKFENYDGVKYETPVIESSGSKYPNVINDETPGLIPKEFRHPDKRRRKT